MFTESVAIVPIVLLSEYIQTVTPVGSDEIARSYEQKLGSPYVRNTSVQHREQGQIFHPYVFSSGISSDRGCQHYVESLPETPHISLKIIKSFVHGLYQTEPDIGAWSKSCAAMCAIGLKRMGYLTAIGGARRLSDLINQMVLGIQGKLAE